VGAARSDAIPDALDTDTSRLEIVVQPFDGTRRYRQDDPIR
jgi:hypothetical protein